jgi:hypothetical protein
MLSPAWGIPLVDQLSTKIAETSVHGTTAHRSLGWIDHHPDAPAQDPRFAEALAIVVPAAELQPGPRTS